MMVQAILDSILPGLLPLLLIVGIYIFFRKKGQKFGRAGICSSWIVSAWFSNRIILN